MAFAKRRSILGSLVAGAVLASLTLAAPLARTASQQQTDAPGAARAIRCAP